MCSSILIVIVGVSVAIGIVTRARVVEIDKFITIQFVKLDVAVLIVVVVLLILVVVGAIVEVATATILVVFGGSGVCQIDVVGLLIAGTGVVAISEVAIIVQVVGWFKRIADSVRLIVACLPVAPRYMVQVVFVLWVVVVHVVLLCVARWRICSLRVLWVVNVHVLLLGTIVTWVGAVVMACSLVIVEVGHVVVANGRLAHITCAVTDVV